MSIEFKDDMKQFRIESLKRLIPKLLATRDKKAGKRIIFVYICTYIITAIIYWQLNESANIIDILFFSLIISSLLMLISSIISYLSFSKNQHEYMIIEKLKTELAVLSDEIEEDLSLEIDKVRNPSIF